MHANFHALGAIALWATLASLGVSLQHVPPFLLTGLALLIGSVPSWPLARHWRVPLPTLALGLYGLFGYHLLLFIALRHAPAVEANLVNYLWPLLIVVLSPVLLPGMRLRPLHAIAALAGFAGAAIAILGAGPRAGGGWSWGFLPALAAALVWSTYSLLTHPQLPHAPVVDPAADARHRALAELEHRPGRRPDHRRGGAGHAGGRGGRRGEVTELLRRPAGPPAPRLRSPGAPMAPGDPCPHAAPPA